MCTIFSTLYEKGRIRIYFFAKLKFPNAQISISKDAFSVLQYSDNDKLIEFFRNCMKFWLAVRFDILSINNFVKLLTCFQGGSHRFLKWHDAKRNNTKRNWWNDSNLICTLRRFLSTDKFLFPKLEKNEINNL